MIDTDTKTIFRDMRVLIVDDDREIRNLIEMMLRELEIKHVARVNDGQEAQEYLEDDGSRVDLIICDWKMPRMDGLELLKLVRKNHPDMPFMMVTGMAELHLVESAKEEGVNAVIAKPFSRTQLHEKMRYIAGQMAPEETPQAPAPDEDDTETVLDETEEETATSE